MEMEGISKRERTNYTGNTKLLVAIWIHCSVFKVNHVCCGLAFLPSACKEMKTQRTKENISLSIYQPPFIPPLSHGYKGWARYKCHLDSWELSITLLELWCVGFATSSFCYWWVG